MAVRIDRVYTKTGDEGKTALIGGQRVEKNHLRIETYGTVDELNAVLGLIVAHATRMPGPHDLAEEILEIMAWMQQDLFNLGADLATSKEYLSEKNPGAKLNANRISDMESTMDRWQETLEPLKSFVLPGGGLISSYLHLARVVCRRAERCVVTLSQQEPVLGPALQYLNRLSDFFFVMARMVSKRLGEPENLWKY